MKIMNNTPKLRFKDENGENYPEWEEKKLGDMLEEENIKTTINNEYEILSSTTNGLFSQLEYFNKEVASSNNIGYKILKRNRIVLSPQNLWMGNINFNDKFDIGIVSPSYKIFKVDNSVNSIFAKYIIKLPKMIFEYEQASEQGASVVRRNLNMDLFKTIKIKLPSLPEQEKIASFLSLFDKKIELQEKKVDSLKEYKKGMMQKMFSQELRFKDENGENYTEWEDKKLEDILKEYSNRNNSNLYKVMSVGKYGIRPRDEIYSKNLSEDISKNKLIYKNTLTIGMGSKQIDIGILHEEAFYSVSPAYTTFEIHNCNPLYLEAYFKKYNRYLSSLYMITGARQGKSINKVDFLKHKIELPSLPEQEKIASLLSTIDKKIELEEKKLEELKEYKKGLLQQMFV